MAKETQTLLFETVLGDVSFTFTNPAQLNQFWGDIASQLGSLGVMGEHSSSHGVFTPDPGDGGRQGVGNVSKTDLRFLNPDELGENNLANGGQGLHAVFQALRLGAAGLPPDAVEAQIGPLFPSAHGQVTFDILF